MLKQQETSGNAALLGRFLDYYRPHKRLFVLDFSCAILSGLLELGFPIAVARFIDTLLPSQNWPLILLATTALLLIYAINTGLMAIVTFWGHMLGINIETEMRRKSFDHLQKLSFRFYDNHKTGHLVARVTKDLEEIGEIAHYGPEDLLIAVMTFLGAFGLMLTVNVKLALITALMVPVTAWITTPLRRAHDAPLERAFQPGRRFQRPHRGKRRRHPGRPGLHQRGSRAALVRAGQCPLPQDQA